MPQVVVLPNSQKCPSGKVLQAQVGSRLCQLMLDQGLEIDHACGQNCACTTCHVILREGESSVPPADSLELSVTRGVFGFGPNSRLSCQVVVGSQNLVVEIP